MNFSQFPTDNLYKFMAIFGLFITLFGIAAFLYITDSNIRINLTYRELGDTTLSSMKDYLIQAKLFSNEFDKKVNQFDIANSYYKKLVNQRAAMIEQNKKNPAITLKNKIIQQNELIDEAYNKIQSIKAELYNYKNKISKIYDTTNILDKKYEPLYDENKKLESLYSWRVYCIMSIICVGIIIMFYGFFLWYTKLQIYQDQIIKFEAENKIKNNNKSSGV